MTDSETPMADPADHASVAGLRAAIAESKTNKAAKPAPSAPTSAGFRGRKIVAGLGTAASIFCSSTVAWLVLDKMSAPEWHETQLWITVPTVLITLGLISVEKLPFFGKKGQP